MNSPRSGFRRASAASWALVGLGVAGVAGASALAYADTFKPQATEAPVAVVEAPAQELAPPPSFDVPQPPSPDSMNAGAPPPPAPVVDAPPPPAPAEPVQPAPTHETYVPDYTPQQPEYTPQQTIEQAPAPTTHAATPPTTKKRNLTPTTVMGPNYSPHVTVSRGS